MANQRPCNKTLTLTTPPHAAKSYCASPVGTLTAVNQVERYQSPTGLQTEHRFNGILGALHIKDRGGAVERLFLLENNEVTRCIMRQVMLWSVARREGFQALLNINLSKQVLDRSFPPCDFTVPFYSYCL